MTMYYTEWYLFPLMITAGHCMDTIARWLRYQLASHIEFPVAWGKWPLIHLSHWSSQGQYLIDHANAGSIPSGIPKLFERQF